MSHPPQIPIFKVVDIILATVRYAGKSLSEALIFASINPTDCSWNYREKYKRRTWAEMSF